jgi:multidrug efflux pump subunit AcrA (membrane-fusion protein)
MTSIHRKWLLPLAAIIALLLIIAWMAGSFREKIEPGLQALQSPGAGEPWIVQIVEVPVTEPVPASIGARQATTISSRTLARITHVTVRAGDTVIQGQMLIELERSDLQARLAQAAEQVHAVEARLKEAQQNLKRAQQLHSQNLVAVAVLDESRSNHDALIADLASARVVERYAEPGDTASPGDKLLSLYNPLSLRIEAAVRETIALPLTLGQSLEVEIPSLNKTLPAQIEELVPAADPASRSFMVRASIDYDGQLLPGMYARLLVPAGRENLLLVPQDLVSEYGQLDVVWVRNDGRTDRRFIRVGRNISPNMIEVISGLEEGDQLLPPPF